MSDYCKISSYNELCKVVDINKIEKAYFFVEPNGPKFELDLNTVFELMKSSNMDDFSPCIYFYGDDFKIIKCEDIDEDYQINFNSFQMLDVKKPINTIKVIPNTVNFYEMKYSDEYKSKVPFITESIKERNKAMEESRNKLEEIEFFTRMIELDRIRDNSFNYPLVDNVKDFTIFDSNVFGEGSYIVVPEFPKHVSYVSIYDKNFLDEKSRKYFDFVGYGYIKDGALECLTYDYSSVDNYNGILSEHASEHCLAMNILEDENKIFKIIGTRGYSLIKNENFIKNHLAEIKQYYENKE